MSEAPQVFVTGATGFIGAWLVHRLLERGCQVRALARSGKPSPAPGFAPGEGPTIEHPRLQWVRGDIADRDGLRPLVEGCQQVYHLAGYAKNWARDPRTYYHVNVDGLRNVLDAAIEHGVKRVVWTSTMLTFGPTPPGTVADEATPRWQPQFLTHYEASKAAGEQVVAEYAGKIDTVIVNPGRVFGPGHLNEGNSISLIIDMYDRGRMPALLGGGRHVGNWVYVHDVVAGHLAAMERGRPAEKYLLGGENLSLKQFLALVDRVSGRKHFQFTVRRPGAMLFAHFQRLRAEWLGIYPQITPDWVRVFLTDWAYTSAKAQRELDYHITPMEAAVGETYAWVKRVRKQGRL